MNRLLQVTSALFVLACGPRGEQPPPGTPHSPPVPPAEPEAPEPENVTAIYEMSVPFGPCNRMHKIFRKKGQAYTEQSKCADPDMPEGEQMALDELTFESTVYVEARLAGGEQEYGEVDVGSIQGAPPQSTRCFQTPGGAHTVCQDGQGIVTYGAFDGHKLDPPKLDANRSMVLVSFEQE